MQRLTTCLLLILGSSVVKCHFRLNYTGDLAGRQLLDFAIRHPVPVGLFTTSAGVPIEVRDTVTINTDTLANTYNLDVGTHVDGERIAERVVHPKGYSTFGYFEVTNDVSKYTSADVFNGIGKKTPLVTRFSVSVANLGGSELNHDHRGMAIKFYTKDGNLDLLCLQVPIYFYMDPLNFRNFVHAFRRNPRTSLYDNTQVWDMLTLRPSSIHTFLWIQSDYGIPDGYRKMDAFPIQTYEIYNKHGERFYVKFNFRTEQGLANLTETLRLAIKGLDADYATRDLYNSIESKNYPAWKLELDVMTEEDVKRVPYNPFDVTVNWRKGDYHTVPVGRLVLDQTVNNHFADSEQAAYNPANLVPGITGPVDNLTKGRKLSYIDAQNYRLGRNHNKIAINLPIYAKTYNRDSNPPLGKNMGDAPNYYPNSFNGPMPYVDESRPERKLVILESNAVDFEEPAYFYNHIIKDDGHRQRLANNLALTLQTVVPNIAKRSLKMLFLIDKDLGKRTAIALRELKAIAMKIPNEVRWEQNAQCYERNTKRKYY